MKYRKRVISLILATLVMVAGRASSANAQDPTPFANCRLGGAGAYTPFIGDYDIAQLNIGRYMDWWNNSNPTSNLGLPAGIEYIQTVRVHQDKGDQWYGPPRDYASNTYRVRPSLTTIASVAASQPGSLWLIGNEIERVDWWQADGWNGQDEITPELYATAFHEIQNAIKTTDPTAKIGIGSVVEATPLRLEYLDRVWDSYLAQYGYPMGGDIDVWNVHGFILREVRDSWGAEVPAGLDDVGGFLYGADISTVAAAHHNVAYFQEFTRALREWMAAHGERNKPLINTEYGILYKSLSGYEISAAQVNDYLTSTLDYMLTATDDDIGFPADENRLVQSWFWYSLNDGYWNGNLFNPNTKALTEFGITWKNYVSDSENPLASQPQQNLLVTNPRAGQDSYLVSPSGSATVTLRVDVANSGNIKTTTGNNIVVNFWDGFPNAPSSNLIASRTLDDIPGCGGFTAVEIEWPDRSVGKHTWYAQAVLIAGETNPNDNITGGVVSVMTRIYLPIVMK
jgi:hypothetical protein